MTIVILLNVIINTIDETPGRFRSVSRWNEITNFLGMLAIEKNVSK